MDLPPALNELSFQVSVTELKTDKVSPSETILGVKVQLLTVWFAIREGAGLTNLLTSFHRFPFNQANNELPVIVVGFLGLPCCGFFKQEKMRAGLLSHCTTNSCSRIPSLC